MKFVFTGDPRHGQIIRTIQNNVVTETTFDAANPLSCIMFDQVFELNGDPVDVTDADQIKALRGNSHFSEVRPRDTGDSAKHGE